MPTQYEEEQYDSVAPKGVEMGPPSGKRPVSGGRRFKAADLELDEPEHQYADAGDMDGSKAAQEERLRKAMEDASLSGKKVLDLTNMPAFLLRPQAPGPRVKCFIKRERSRLKMFPTYRMYLQNGERFLLSATRIKMSTFPNYVISTDAQDPHKETKYFGRLVATYNGLEWSLSDNGAPWSKPSGFELARELGAVYFAPTGKDMVDRFMGTARAQRKIKAILPPVDPETLERTEWVPRKANDEILNWYKTNSDEVDHVALISKKSEWNPDTRQYELNFFGRAQMASVKNFQLCDKENPENVILQMGKVKDDVYTLDYTFPFCPLQAFAAALASLDTKLSAE